MTESNKNKSTKESTSIDKKRSAIHKIVTGAGFAASVTMTPSFVEKTGRE